MSSSRKSRCSRPGEPDGKLGRIWNSCGSRSVVIPPGRARRKSCNSVRKRDSERKRDSVRKRDSDEPGNWFPSGSPRRDQQLTATQHDPRSIGSPSGSPGREQRLKLVSPAGGKRFLLGFPDREQTAGATGGSFGPPVSGADCGGRTTDFPRNRHDPICGLIRRKRDQSRRRSLPLHWRPRAAASGTRNRCSDPEKDKQKLHAFDRASPCESKNVAFTAPREDSRARSARGVAIGLATRSRRPTSQRIPQLTPSDGRRSCARSALFTRSDEGYFLQTDGFLLGIVHPGRRIRSYARSSAPALTPRRETP